MGSPRAVPAPHTCRTGAGPAAPAPPRALHRPAPASGVHAVVSDPMAHVAGPPLAEAVECLEQRPPRHPRHPPDHRPPIAWSMAERQLEAVLPTCAELGVMVVPYGPLGAGLLIGDLAVPDRADRDGPVTAAAGHLEQLDAVARRRASALAAPRARLPPCPACASVLAAPHDRPAAPPGVRQCTCGASRSRAAPAATWQPAQRLIEGPPPVRRRASPRPGVGRGRPGCRHRCRPRRT